MGGGQANKQQAAQANAAANASETASANLSNENLAEQKQNYNYLFGSNGQGGSLTPMMNPASLNVTEPTGAYKAQLNNTENTLNSNFNNQRGTLAQSFANNGFSAGMPNGYQADAMRQLSRDQADANGTAFTSAVGQQYQDALNNFWNANNVASGQAASARTGALQGAQNEGSTATGIYSTAGQYHASPMTSVVGSGIQAGGSVGAAAMCPARGAMIALRGGMEKRVEDLEIGDDIIQRNNTSHRLEEKPVPVRVPCVTVNTADLRRSTVSRNHAFDLHRGGYTEAHESLHRRIAAREEYDVVVAVHDAGEREVFPLKPGGNHTYLCDGLWSLE